MLVGTSQEHHRKEGFYLRQLAAEVAHDIPARPPRAKNILIDLSAGNTWEAAQREWKYTGEYLDDGVVEFPERCELCNEANLKHVYRIRNVINGGEAWVGGDCIKRFLILDGAETIEDSRRMFEHQVRRARLADYLLNIGTRLICNEDPDLSLAEIRSFRNRLRTYLEIDHLDQKTLDPAIWDSILRVTTGVGWRGLSKGDVARIRDAIFAPAKIVGKANIMRNQPVESANVIRGKTRVATSFSRSIRTDAEKNRGVVLPP